MTVEIYIKNTVTGFPQPEPFSINLDVVPSKGDRIAVQQFLGDPDDYERFSKFKSDYLKQIEVEEVNSGNPFSTDTMMVIGITHKAYEAGHFVSLEAIFKF